MDTRNDLRFISFLTLFKSIQKSINKPIYKNKIGHCADQDAKLKEIFKNLILKGINHFVGEAVTLPKEKIKDLFYFSLILYSTLFDQEFRILNIQIDHLSYKMSYNRVIDLLSEFDFYNKVIVDKNIIKNKINYEQNQKGTNKSFHDNENLVWLKVFLFYKLIFVNLDILDNCQHSIVHSRLDDLIKDQIKILDQDLSDIKDKDLYRGGVMKGFEDWSKELYSESLRTIFSVDYYTDFNGKLCLQLK